MMSEAAVRRTSRTTPQLGSFYDLHSFETLDSTNDQARRLAEDGAAEGALVWARSQGAGRGRRGRAWLSPPGNLYASLLVRPDCQAYTAAQLSFVAALAIHQAVCSALSKPERADLKWPNDVLIAGRKVAGILLESRFVGGAGLDWLIIGTGINIAVFPSDVERPATSLRAEGSAAEVVDVLEDYASAFVKYYRQWLAEGFAPIRAAWLARAHGVGEMIDVRLVNETFSGVFEGLDDNGALQVRTADGLRIVTSGDVFLPGRE
jgi:BirA family biotin operon repressor/biotin-[acetyl-CoA-carboxylase] ligase